MASSDSTPKPKKSPVAGYIFIFAVGLEIVALVLGGFAVALFGLVAFALGIAYIGASMAYDPDSMIASLTKIKRDEESRE